MIYEKKLSDSIKKLMFQVMKNATKLEKGFIQFNNRTIIKAYYDKEGCDEFLESLVINQENVLRYLDRKYIPTVVENGCLFKDQKCIQRALIKEDGTLYIHIKNSEPHKIITDTVHVMKILKAQGFKFLPEIKFYIEQVKIAYQDTMLYNLCLDEFGFKVPSPARQYERQLKPKFTKLEDVARIKKRSVKRKFLRWRVKEGKIIWSELRKIINITDYSEHNIRVVCSEIREAARQRGVTIDF